MMQNMRLEDDHWCFVCGKGNNSGLKLDFEIKDGKSRAVFIPDKRLQGFKNIVHGGIISAVLDEAMGKLAFAIGLNTVTAKLEINLRKPTIIGEEYAAYGEIVEETEKKVIAKAELKKKDGTLVADARGLLIKVKKD